MSDAGVHGTGKSVYCRDPGNGQKRRELEGRSWLLIGLKAVRRGQSCLQGLEPDE